MDGDTQRHNLFSNFLVGENEHWVIILGPEATKCGWLTLDLILKCDPSISFRIAFNQVYRKTDNGEEWNRLLDQMPDAASWFFDTVDLRFPFCQICKDMWEANGCVFDEDDQEKTDGPVDG